VTINVPDEGKTTPSRRDIIRPLEAQVSSYDWATVASSGTLPEFELQARDWKLRFRVHPVTRRVAVIRCSR
jgi:hypothetical protein